MKRILLIGPITDFSAGETNWSAPPLGIHKIAAYLNRNGHYAEVWDCNIHKDLEKKLKEGWRIVGFSTLQNTLHNDIKAMWRAKELCPDAVLVAGGIEATLNFQDILQHSPVKIVITAEGESQMLALANGVSLENINGIVLKKDSMPMTDDDFANYWEAMDFTKMGYEQYWAEMRKMHPDDYDASGGDTIRLISSNLCSRGCAFCSVTQYHRFACGRAVRTSMLNAKQLHGLVLKIKAQLPSVKTLYYCEDDVIQNRARIFDYFALLKSSGIQLRHQFQTHTSRLLNNNGFVDMELLKAMKDGGVEHITMGVENVCPHCLDYFHKPQKIDRVPDIIRACLELKIRPYILTIFFVPIAKKECLWKNYETLTKWIEMGATVSSEPNVMCYRGSELYTSDHVMLYKTFRIDNRNQLRTPVAILPDDPEVRYVQKLFNARWREFVTNKDIKHKFKGNTGKVCVELLGQVLRESEGKKLEGYGIDEWLWNGSITNIKS